MYITSYQNHFISQKWRPWRPDCIMKQTERRTHEKCIWGVNSKFLSYLTGPPECQKIWWVQGYAEGIIFNAPFPLIGIGFTKVHIFWEGLTSSSSGGSALTTISACFITDFEGRIPTIYIHKGVFFSESVMCFSNLLISKKNILKNYPELEI